MNCHLPAVSGVKSPANVLPGMILLLLFFSSFFLFSVFLRIKFKIKKEGKKIVNKLRRLFYLFSKVPMRKRKSLLWRKRRTDKKRIEKCIRRSICVFALNEVKVSRMVVVESLFNLLVKNSVKPHTNKKKKKRREKNKTQFLVIRWYFVAIKIWIRIRAKQKEKKTRDRKQNTNKKRKKIE